MPALNAKQAIAAATGRKNAQFLEKALSNLLDDCIEVRPGEKILIVAEPDESFYRGGLAVLAAQAAEARGAVAEIVVEPPVAGPESFPASLSSIIEQTDHTLFFSRIGSTARFLKLPGPGRKVVSYTLDYDSLASPFSALPYGFMQDLHDAIVERISKARLARLTCPNGTDLRITLTPRAETGTSASALTPFAVRNFPLMIVPAISAATAEGRLALSLALLSTSTHHYEDAVLPLDTPLILTLAGGRITDFGGEPRQAAKAQAHFDRVGKLFDADARNVSSWHTGINPGTFFTGPALSDLERWGNIAFGSPRYTHFHMVGRDPGDICGSLFDATIAFDDEVIWRDGKLAFLSTDDGRALIERHGVDPSLIATVQPIGV